MALSLFALTAFGATFNFAEARISAAAEAVVDDALFWSRQLQSSYPTSSRQLKRRDKQHPLKRAGIDLFLQESVNEACSSSERISVTSILLVHSLTYSSHEYDVQYKDYSLVDRLLNECKVVWSLDIAGYGRSGPVDGFLPNTDYAAKDIDAAVQYITSLSDQPRKVDLFGWSWGTNTITRYVENFANEHKVRRIVLYSPLINAFDGSPDDLNDKHNNNWKHAASDFQTDDDGNIDFDIAEPSAVHEFLSNCWRYDENTSPNGGRVDLLAGSDVQLFDPAKLDVPVLMIGGSADPLLYLDLLEKGFEDLPRRAKSKLMILEGAGHILMLEKGHYRRLQEAVVEFLR